MNIYFSGIGGVGLGPLAEIAFDAGYGVCGSDAAESLITRQLRERGIPLVTGQDGSYLRACHEEKPLDLLVYTSSLPLDHPELVLARELGIKTAKRDELLARIIKEKDLKLIAVAGTHGKTTTTGMLVWAIKQLGIPVSYSVGTTLSFGPSGKYDPASRYFVYECDEFDRNFLHFSPYLSLITSVDYDHPDTYPTESDYLEAFRQFIGQSDHTIMWQSGNRLVEAAGERIWQLGDDEVMKITLAGEHNRRNASLVVKAIEYIKLGSSDEIMGILSNFPGTDRRFERLADNLYSDYGHHPVEIAATLQLARELSERIVLVYQPHQNVRQHEIRDLYTDCFVLADEVIWLPTYLSRENPALPILNPPELAENVTNKQVVSFAELNKELWQNIQQHRAAGTLVLCMGAGSIDGWLRAQLSTS